MPQTLTQFFWKYTPHPGQKTRLIGIRGTPRRSRYLAPCKVWILGFTLWIPTSRYRISYSLICRWNVISRSYRKRNSGFLELCFRLESTRLHFRSKNFQDHLTLGKVDVTCIWDDVSETQRCNIVSNSYNVVPRLQDCVELKIVDANRPV